MATCPKCNGKGWYNKGLFEKPKCRLCGGTGEVSTGTKKCTNCDGKGWVYRHGVEHRTCPICAGTGKEV